jgi:hypothetical protein
MLQCHIIWLTSIQAVYFSYYWERCGHDHDRMVVGFATTCAYHH